MDNFYSFEREESPGGSVHYVFSTDFNLIYSVYFNPPDFSKFLNNLPHLSKHGRLFGFFPITEIPSKKMADPLVSNTICKIVEDYFHTYGNDKVLLYHCDSEDDRQGSRFRLFKRWLTNPSEMNIHFDGKEIEIDLPGASKRIEYLGFIAHAEDEKSLHTIHEEFIEISVLLIDHK